MIQEFGFELIGEKRDGEKIYLKRIRPKNQPSFDIKFSQKFYPSFFDGDECNKFIIPIKPEYHKKLFPQLNQQPSLFREELIAEGNAIKKVYLCHAQTKQIEPGDIVFFYRSEDEQSITTVAIIEKIFINQTSWKDAVRITSKRTVYSEDELKEILEKKTLILLFWWHFDLKKPIRMEELKECKVLKASPQSITKITHESYIKIKTLGGINERYTFN